MIKLLRPPAKRVLSPKVREALVEHHRWARRRQPRSKQLATKWSNFRSQKRGRFAGAGEELFEALKGWSHNKCAYCEQVAPRTIDHRYPKIDYPKKMFRWRNLFPCCSTCQERRDALTLDAQGRPLILDPCEDEPLDYLRYDDLTGATLSNPTSPKKERADETRKAFSLHLYDGERGRKLANVRYLLSNLINEDPIRDETRALLKDHLSPKGPWLGILRAMILTPEKESDRALWDAAVAKLPELRAWVAPWLSPPPWAPADWRAA